MLMMPSALKSHVSNVLDHDMVISDHKDTHEKSADPVKQSFILKTQLPTGKIMSGLRALPLTSEPEPHGSHPFFPFAGDQGEVS